MAALQKLLDEVYGKPDYLELVARYEPASENRRLLQLALNKSLDGLGRDAARQLLKQGGAALIWPVLNDPDSEKASQMVMALRMVGSRESLEMLKTVALDEKRPQTLRMNATRALGASGGGEDLVLALLKSGDIRGDYKKAAVQGVSNAWRRSVRTEAAAYLDAPTTAEGRKMPGIPELLALSGDARKGLTIFKTNCAVCHQVNNEGMDFGPKLSEIGSKLPKEGQYLAILHPDAGISFGYEGWEVTFKDGSTLTGIVASKTETDLQMKFPGGVATAYKMADVKSMKKLDASMMPSGLHEAMSTQELVDLVEYLTTLKRK